MIFFHRRTNTIQGQLATFLILLMVVVLIFILVTVNLGQVSLQALTISNAADSAALFLGSQLATKAHLFYVAVHKALQEGATCDASVGDYCTKVCGRDGILPIVATVAVVIIYIAVVVVSGGTLSATAAGIAGAIGGGIGAGITYETPEAALSGAAQGFLIGYSIGSAANYLGVERLGAGPGAIGSPAPQLLINHPLRIAAATGLVGGGQIYAGYVNEKATAAAFANVSKQLNALNEKDAFIQGAYFTALSQVVDDPAMVEDTTDINSNGDTQEKVSKFLVWWEEWLNGIKTATLEVRAATNIFLDELRYRTDDFCSLWDPTKNPRKDFAKELGYYTEYYPPLARKEVTLDKDKDGKDKEGAIVKAWRDLEAAKPPYNIVAFEKEIPDKIASALKLRYTHPALWLNLNEPKGYAPPFDEETALIDELFGFYALAQPLINNPENAGKTWDSWIGQFYDPYSDKDLYDIWGIYIKGGNLPGKEGKKGPYFSGLDGPEGWKAELEKIKKEVRLTTCDFGKCDPDVSTKCEARNYPCKFNPSPFGEAGGGAPVPATPGPTVPTPFTIFAEKYTTDSDPYNRDEFEAAETAITGIINEMNEVRELVKNFYIDNCDKMVKSRESAEYRWVDSRCPAGTDPSCPDSAPCHRVKVEASDFKVPRVFNSKEHVGDWGPKLVHDDCVTMADYSGKIGITITRRDPANKKIGIGGLLGSWNPSGKDFMEIKRTAYTSYTFHNVELDKPDKQ